MTSNRAISIIIPNWNGRDLLSENLPSILEAARSYQGECEIIVVDDGSTDDSVDYVRRRFPEIRLIMLPINKGFSHAVNRGVMEASHDIVCLLNSDIRVTSDFIEPAIKYFDDKKTFGVANIAMENKNAALTRPHCMIFRHGFFKEKYINPGQRATYAFGASGGHSFIHRKKFLELGGFDEVFSPFYYEDADLSYRAWKRGYRIYLEPKSTVYHKNRATIGKAHNERFIHYVFNRNRILFMWKNVTDRDYLVQHILFLPLFLIWQARRDPVVFLSFLAAAVKMPEILRKRKKEKKDIIFSDKDILRFIEEGP